MADGHWRFAWRAHIAHETKTAASGVALPTMGQSTRGIALHLAAKGKQLVVSPFTFHSDGIGHQHRAGVTDGQHTRR